MRRDRYVLLRRPLAKIAVFGKTCASCRRTESGSAALVMLERPGPADFPPSSTEASLARTLLRYLRGDAPLTNSFASRLDVACAIAAIGLVASVSLSGDARAHLDSLAALGHLHEQIESEPDNAELFLRRGNLNVEARRWDEALSDYERAGRLDETGREVLDLNRGHVFLSAGWPLTATFYLRRFVEQHGPSAQAYLDLARAARLRGRVDESVEFFEKLISLTPTPHPDRFIEWARVYAEAGRTAQAIAVLDRGVDTIGPASGLHLAALDLEIESGLDDDALERLDRLSRDSYRPELWSIRRADLLIEKSRYAEAQQQLEATLQVLVARPPHRRNTAAMQELERAVQVRLARIKHAYEQESEDEQ